MKLQNLRQETNRLAREFLNENPTLMKKYVDLGLGAVGKTVSILSGFMKHLIVVQKLDPNTNPGSRQLKELQEAMNATFEKYHAKPFDEDYDFSWVHKKWEQTKNQLNSQMTKEQFMDLTDVGTLTNKTSEPSTITQDLNQSVVNQIAPESLKREIKIEEVVQVRGNRNVFDPGDALMQLKDEVERIESLEKDSKKTPVKPGKKKLNKIIRNTVDVIDEMPNIEVKVDRKSTVNYHPAGRGSLSHIAQDRKAKNKTKVEATPKFKKEMKIKVARATAFVDKLIQAQFIASDEHSRLLKIQSMVGWNDSNYASMENIISKYAPTKDAIAEGKFKGSFTRSSSKRK